MYVASHSVHPQEKVTEFAVTAILQMGPECSDIMIMVAMESWVLPITAQAVVFMGRVISASGYGVSGVNYATSGWSIGVYGETSSPDGASVIGSNQATTGSSNGVLGISSSADGASAVVGWNEAGGIGLQGYSTTGTALTVGSMHAEVLLKLIRVMVSNLKFYVANDGNVYADGAYQSPAADFAELLPAHNGLEPGDVLIIDARWTTCA